MIAFVQIYTASVLLVYGAGVVLTGRLLFFTQRVSSLRVVPNLGTLAGQVGYLAGTLLAVQEHRLRKRLIGLVCILGSFGILLFRGA